MKKNETITDPYSCLVCEMFNNKDSYCEQYKDKVPREFAEKKNNGCKYYISDVPW